MSRRLKDKIAIITGAASGIGRSTALAFAKEGANLVLNDIDEEKLSTLEKEVSALSSVDVVLGDISIESTANSLVEMAIQKYDRVDVLVNNAGIHYIEDITDVTPEDFDYCVGVNMKSMFLSSKAVIPKMVEQKSGSIINLGSISSFVGQEMMGKSTFLYNMTKAAATQLARSLATRYGEDGIRANAVCPGATKTDQIKEKHLGDTPEEDFWNAVGSAHAMKRHGSPDEIANAIVFLASDESSFVTGASLVVDGGYLAK